MSFSYFTFVLILLFLSSFQSCTSEDKLSTETLAKIYVENLIIEEQYQNQDSVNVKKEEILKNYSVTKSDFESAIKSLDYDKEKWENFFALSKSYLDTLQAQFDREDSKKK